MTQGHICDYEPVVWCTTCKDFYGKGSSHFDIPHYPKYLRCRTCKHLSSYAKEATMSEDHPQVSERLARVEITDEMVERAMKALWNNVTPFTGISPSLVNDMRRALDAALNPPPRDPEIPVTQEMLDAGAKAFLRFGGRLPARTVQTDEWWSTLYRAMRKLEPKP